jgi:hypothetical protein
VLTSHKKPPEVGICDASGGTASLVLARIVWIQPRLALVTGWRAARKPASQRRWKPM